jgi:hypothetical protein
MDVGHAGVGTGAARDAVSGRYPALDLELEIKGGVHGDRATAAMVVNTIPRVVSARPGVLTMDDIPISFR